MFEVSYVASVYLDPTDENIVPLIDRGISGPVTMLNLLRFRDVADYSATPELASSETLTGREAYDLYIEHTRPFLEASRGSITFLGDGGTMFIGPPDEGWDLVMLIKQNSIDDFFAFATNEEYLAGMGHRTAALIDSRLLPLVERV